jgi:hypothetical protein
LQALFSTAGILIRSSTALRAHGFSLPVHVAGKTSVAYVAQQINGSLRSGVSRALAPELSGWFRDEIQESPENKELHNAVAPSFRTCVVQILGRAQHAACFPLAAAAIPYVRWRRDTLARTCICLARRPNPAQP